MSSFLKVSSSSIYWRILATFSVPIICTSIYLFMKKRKPSAKPIKRTFSVQNGLLDEGSPEEQLTVKTFSSLGLEQPVVIAMVGLPARGKSYIVKMLIRYLKWTGYECEVFNVGSYRRKIGLASADSTFFQAGNSDAQKVREDMAMAVQDMMYSWLHEEGSKVRVGIFDATNTTKSRRFALAERARKENVFLLFVESICNDKEVLTRNYELKLQNDDYKGMDAAKARTDFLSRVEAYERVYETIEDAEDSNQISYIQLINVGQKVITRNCAGYLPSQVAFYLQNVHILPRKIFLTLNAENLDLVEEDPSRLAGAESGRLTEAGMQYSTDLARYIYARTELMQDLGKEVLVLAGTARVHSETMLHLRNLYSCYHTPLLNELRGGELHGLSHEEVKKSYPQEHERRLADKLRYRYPGVGGESYLDVIERIRPVIIELERQRRSVVIICHLAVLRCIWAYFHGTDSKEIPFLAFRRHCVYELTPGPFGCTFEEKYPSEELKHI